VRFSHAVVAKTPTKTPLKKVNIQNFALEDLCRLCNVNVRISGRGRFNIFHGTKSVTSKISERLSSLLGLSSIPQDRSLPSIICSKCKRVFEKLEKTNAELHELKETYQKSLEHQLAAVKHKDENVQERYKRCTRDSPSSSTQKKKVAKVDVHRNILIESNKNPELEIHDDLIVHPKLKNRNADVKVNIS
jgi:hypothetical protein